MLQERDLNLKSLLLLLFLKCSISDPLIFSEINVEKNQNLEKVMNVLLLIFIEYNLKTKTFRVVSMKHGFYMIIFKLKTIFLNVIFTNFTSYRK